MKADIVLHATLEAGIKKGGIGATLFGLLSLPEYHADVGRSVLLGPLRRNNRTEWETIRGNIQLLYSVRDDVRCDDDELNGKFAAIEARYGVEILYGKRSYRERRVDVLLLDARAARAERVNLFKRQVFDRFAFPSDEWEHDGEFEEFMRIAVPGLRAAYALTGLREQGRKLLVAHDVVALPFVFAACLLDFGLETRVFLHEIPCARDVVEGDPGRDIAFYNRIGVPAGPPVCQNLDCLGCFRLPFLSCLRHADRVLAVGGFLARELSAFLPDPLPVRTVYRGIPCYDYPFERRQQARDRLVNWASAILGFRPDYLFTRVTRMIPSKALYRDLQVLQALDARLDADGRRAIHIVLSSVVPEGRHPEEIRQMEQEYGWPVIHRTGYPDLISHEEDFYAQVTAFNRNARAIRAVLVNQFGWSRERVGQAIPVEMDFRDLRLGTHAEFGLSVYEPFGIGPLEPLTSGAISLISSSCGSLPLLRSEWKADPGALPAAITEDPVNLLVADYIGEGAGSPPAGVHVTAEERRERELRVAARVAEELHRRLPRTFDDEIALFRAGFELARRFSWSRVYDERYREALFD